MSWHDSDAADRAHRHGRAVAVAVDVPDTVLAELAEIAPMAQRRRIDGRRVAGLVAARPALVARR